MRESLVGYFDEVRDLGCAPLLRAVVEQVAALDAELDVEVGPFGLRFQQGGALLCEFSVFGELFIARVGQEQAVEYRVRGPAVACAALEHVQREFLSRRSAAPAP
jgi:hypothetical protein